MRGPGSRRARTTTVMVRQLLRLRPRSKIGIATTASLGGAAICAMSVARACARVRVPVRSSRDTQTGEVDYRVRPANHVPRRCSTPTLASQVLDSLCEREDSVCGHS